MTSQFESRPRIAGIGVNGTRIESDDRAAAVKPALRPGSKKEYFQ